MSDWLSKITLGEEDDWVCGICLDGENNKPRIFHDCGKHDFHKPCLDQCRDRRCPICRFDPKKSSPKLALYPVYLISQSVYRTMPNAVDRIRLGAFVAYVGNTNHLECVHCLRSIYFYQRPHKYSGIQCNHYAHSYCIVNSLLRNGMTQGGEPFCPLCNYHPHPKPVPQSQIPEAFQPFYQLDILESYNEIGNLDDGTRLRPRLQRCTSPNFTVECSMCLGAITGVNTYYKYLDCDHYVHADCACANLVENGVDQSGAMYCPSCHYAGSTGSIMFS
jgi:hypothetical protein